MATPDSFLDMLRRNPRGWGNLAPEPEQAQPKAIFDEYGQPHDTVTGHPLYQNSALPKSASDSLHDIAMSPVNMAMAPVHALTSLSELGGFPNPQNPQNQQDVSALVASLFGGSAMSPARAGEAGAMRALSDTSGPAFNAIDHPINLFHGTAGPVDRFNTRDLWASPSERTAGRYADQAAAKTGSDKNIIPMELHSDKIMTPAQRWMDANTARQQALDGGYDAINWGPFETGGGDYYQVVRPNTVRHAETGETLFSDTGKPSLLGSALAGAESHLRPGLSLDGHKGPSSTDYNIMMHDQNIGRAYVREFPETVQIGNFSINPEHQRQGIGTEVQREVARLHGKPNVPDGTLSDMELGRWQKNDPAAVADYEKMFEGASSSNPKYGSDAYWASQGRGVVPGTRAAAGELFSDTGKPSIIGSALAGAKTADIVPETFLAAGHPSSSLVPMRPQGGHLEGNPLDQMLAASPSQREQGGRSSIESDHLPGSFGVSDDEINAIRKDYIEGKPLASNWYLHGRHSSELSDVNPIQMTKDYDTMRQYGRGYSDPPKGSGWAISPTDQAKVLDFTSTDTPDIRSAAARLMRDSRTGNNPILDDVRNGLDSPTPREISENIRSQFSPDGIVNSAQAFDNPDWYGALLNSMSPDFIKTPDGAVGFLDRDAGTIKAVRLFSDTGKPSPLGAALAGAEEQKGITAYHGSPHDFDKFDLSKIGTGEGAQAYGHGLYFADNEGVAKSYRDALSHGYEVALPNGTKRPVQGDVEPFLAADHKDFSGDTEALRKSYEETLASLSPTNAWDKQTHRDVSKRLAVLNEWEGAGMKPTNPGHMYQVRLNADPEHFLDWDKPLSGQNDVVKTLLKSKEIKGMTEAFKETGSPWDNIRQNGMALDQFVPLRSHLNNPENIAEFRDAGIPGIRYLDGGSRDAGQGSHNYVVFNPEIIELLKKYGIAGPMLGQGVGSLIGGRDDQQK